MKSLLFRHTNQERHWVGDGFPVRTIFSYNDIAREVSPFLLLDYAGPAEFAPSPDHLRGVGEHPHRGFETVTIVYAGEVEHRDSAGGGGKIGPGDVQWMTAASGLVHEEMHGREFAKRGGTFEMIQLWVNLPAKNKMNKPRYQGIKASEIPQVELEQKAGLLRVIAGEFAGKKGPAKTFTPVNLWDVRLHAGHAAKLQMPAGHTCLLFVLEGTIRVESGEVIAPAELAVLDKSDANFSISSLEEAKILVLGGEPLNEPIAAYGPFVMNTMGEIKQAINDFNSGKMGQIESIEGSEA